MGGGGLGRGGCDWLTPVKSFSHCSLVTEDSGFDLVYTVQCVILDWPLLTLPLGRDHDVPHIVEAHVGLSLSPDHEFLGRSNGALLLLNS